MALNISASSRRRRVFLTYTHERKTTTTKRTNETKGKIKNTQATWGHKNEVIQVRCVEIKLKVNNNNNNNINNGRRSAGTKPQRRSWFILSSYWSPPLSCWAVSRPISDFPPFISTCRFGYVITQVTLWRAVMLVKAFGSTSIPAAAARV